MLRRAAQVADRINPDSAVGRARASVKKNAVFSLSAAACLLEHVRSAICERWWLARPQ